MLEFKAARYTNSALALQVKDTSLPVEVIDGAYKLPKSTNVLVKVHAAALNPLDVVIRSSLTPLLFRAERGLGGDYSGDVVAIGDAAAAELSLKIGDKVCGLYLENFLLGPGSIAEYILIDTKNPTGTNVRKFPESLSYQQAAAYPLVFGTAQIMFDDVPKTNSFEKILVLGAGTSVGRFVVQLAKKVYKSKEIVVTCSGRTEAIIRELGADKVIDYTKHKSMLAPVLEEVKDGKQFDVIFDCCGNSDLFANMSQILKSNKDGGAYITIAGDNKMVFNKSFLIASLKNLSCQIRKLRSSWGLLSYHFNMTIFTGMGQWATQCVENFENHKIQIFIDSEYPLDKVDDAFKRVESNKAAGKVVVNVC